MTKESDSAGSQQMLTTIQEARQQTFCPKEGLAERPGPLLFHAACGSKDGRFSFAAISGVWASKTHLQLGITKIHSGEILMSHTALVFGAGISC